MKMSYNSLSGSLAYRGRVLPRNFQFGSAFIYIFALVFRAISSTPRGLAAYLYEVLFQNRCHDYNDQIMTICLAFEYSGHLKQIK